MHTKMIVYKKKSYCWFLRLS